MCTNNDIVKITKSIIEVKSSNKNPICNFKSLRSTQLYKTIVLIDLHKTTS